MTQNLPERTETPFDMDAIQRAVDAETPEMTKAQRARVRLPRDHPDNPYRIGQVNARGEKICGNRKASWPHDPIPCTATIVMSNGRCHKHGGKSLGGPAHPNFKSGKYSKVALPPNMLEAYEEARMDPELLSMREEIAMLDMRLIDLFNRYEMSGGAETWNRVKRAYKKLRKGLTYGEIDMQMDAIMEMERIFEGERPDHELWAEIMTTMEMRRRVGESERKRLVDMNQMWTNDQMMVTFAQMVDALREFITDRKLLNALGRRLIDIAAGNTRE